MKKHTFLTFSLATFLLSSTSLLAATPDEQVKALANKIHDQQKNYLTLQGIQTKETGTLTVTDQGKYFTITYPSLSLTLPEGQMDVGVITMNVMPGTKEHEWKMTMALPSAMKFTPSDTGASSLDITVGGQRFSSIFDETTLIGHVVDAQYQNIKIIDQATKKSLTFGGFDIKTNLSETQPGQISGPIALIAKDIVIDEPAPTSTKMQIGSVAIDASVDKLDIEMSRQYQQKLNELAATGFNMNKIDSPEALGALWKIIMDHGLQQMDGMAATVKLKDLAFSMAPSEKTTTPTNFKIDEIGYKIEATGLKSEKSSGKFGLNWAGGMTPPGLAPELAKYLPQSVNLSFGYTDLPHKALMSQLGEIAVAGMTADKTAGSASAKNEAMKMVGMQAAMSFPALLAQNSTVFTIDNTDIKAADYAINLNGRFQASPQAVFGGAGTAKVVFTGLDQIITDLQNLSAKPDLDPNLKAQIPQVLQGLAGMQMFGQQGTDASGKAARTYDLVLDEKGAIKLNGTDMSALMGGGNPAAGAGGSNATTDTQMIDQMNAIDHDIAK